jgi:hypothetical protein
MTLLKSGWLATGVGEGVGAGVGDGVGVAIGVGDGTGVGVGVGFGVATGVGLGVGDGVGVGVGATMGLVADAGKTTRFCSTAEGFAGLATKPMARDWPGARVVFHDLGVTL